MRVRRSTFNASGPCTLGRRVLLDDITYDIFKDDPIGTPLWLEAVQGLERAMNRMEELAAAEDCEYYLFCSQVGKIVRRMKRKSPRPEDKADGRSRKMAG